MALASAIPVTLFDSLLAAIRKASDYNRDDTVPPAAVLWPDERREWEKLVPRLLVVLPGTDTRRVVDEYGLVVGSPIVEMDGMKLCPATLPGDRGD